MVVCHPQLVGFLGGGGERGGGEVVVVFFLGDRVNVVATLCVCEERLELFVVIVVV